MSFLGQQVRKLFCECARATKYLTFAAEQTFEQHLCLTLPYVHIFRVSRDLSVQLR